MDNAQNGYSSADNTGKIMKKLIYNLILDFGKSGKNLVYNDRNQ